MSGLALQPITECGTGSFVRIWTITTAVTKPGCWLFVNITLCNFIAIVCGFIHDWQSLFARSIFIIGAFRSLIGVFIFLIPFRKLKSPISAILLLFVLATLFIFIILWLIYPFFTLMSRLLSEFILFGFILTESIHLMWLALTYKFIFIDLQWLFLLARIGLEIRPKLVCLWGLWVDFTFFHSSAEGYFFPC
jgi:hypothetical protein